VKTVFVYNPKSGSAQSKSELQKLTAAANIHIDIWLPINAQFSQKLTELLKNPIRVLAYGGDGTISSVAGLLAGTSSVLVPLPGGTLNHFSKDLGVSQDIETALGELHTWAQQKIDIASVNDHYFINNSSIGVYARSLETRDQLSGKVAKWPAAIWATLKEIVQFRTYKVQLNNTWHRTPLMFIGNNHYSLSSGKLGVRHKINTGKLSIYIAKASSRLAMFGIGIGLLIGKKADLIEEKSGESTIRFKNKQVVVSVDGEKIRMTTPLTYRIHQAALTVLIPK
jgi:diacylglycerol kinase family enzyme